MSDIEKLNQVIQTREAELTKVKQQNDEFIDQITKLTSQIGTLTDEIASLRKQFADQQRPDQHNLNPNAKRVRYDAISPSNANPVQNQSKSTGIVQPNDKSDAAERTEKMITDQQVDDTQTNTIAAPTFASLLASNKITKPTPIQLGDYQRTDLDKIVVELGNKFQPDEYEINQMRPGAPCKIYPSNIEVKQQIAEFLSEKGAQFCSFTDKADKKTAFIVRGLNFGQVNQNIGFISTAVREAGIVAGFTVKIFETPHMKRNTDGNKQPSLYQIVLDGDANIQLLESIKAINGIRISIEKMKKTSILQCHRCQRFNHSAGQCHFGYRCVQCIGQHQPGQCPRITNKNLPVQCINCACSNIKENGHTANNLSECQYFRKNHRKLHNLFASNGNRKTTQPNGENSSTTTNFTPSNANDLTDPVRSNNPPGSKNSKKTANRNNKSNKANNANGTNRANAKKSNHKAGESNSEVINSLASLNPQQIQALTLLINLLKK